MLLDELPEGLDEKEMATALINDALLTSLRLGLEVVLTDFQAARPTLHLVYSEDLAS